MKSRPDPQLTAAARIIENLAARITAVDDHVRWELAQADSLPDHTPGAGDADGTPSSPLTGVCEAYVPVYDAHGLLLAHRYCHRYRPCGEHDTPVTLTAVERAAERRLRLNREHSDFKAQCKLIVIAASDALRSADSLLGARLEQFLHGEAERIMECRDGQHGKEGAIEWADPTCAKPSVKANLCQAHYSKWVRWRTTHGKKTPEIEDAA